jgi:hypothetical protein
VTTEKTPTDPAALRADIERTRAELGDTIEALAGKADVTGRAKEAAGAATAKVRQRSEQVVHDIAERAHHVQEALPEKARDVGARLRRRPAGVLVAAAALVALAVGIALIRRRSAHRHAHGR